MSQSNPDPTPTSGPSSQISINDNLIVGDENYIAVNENMQNENSAETLTVGGKKRSSIWEHFQEVCKNGVSKAICNYCKQQFSCGSGTSHLGRHLKLSCKKRPNQDIKQLLITRASKESGSDIKSFKFDASVSRKDLAKLVVCAELSFKFVEHPIFVEFVRGLQPLFQIPGRLTIKNECVALYEEERQNLYNVLKNLDCRVSFTTDMWTSNQKLGYMALTAHYIDNAFVLRKKIINFKKVSYPHTSYALSDAINKCLIDWDLDSRVFTLTLDNCTTNDALVTKFREHLGEKLIFKGEYIHIRCCAHILNILVQDGMKIMHNAIENVRSIIRHVTASPSRLQVFNDITQQKRLPARKGLVLDVSTRWNSTYDMLHNALGYKDAFMMYGEEHCQSMRLTNEDWNNADTICKFLKYFVDATKNFSRSKFPTSSSYFKEVWNIRGLLLEESVSDNGLVRTLALEMQKKFSKYWSEFNRFLCVANALDPRSKLAFMDWCFRQSFDEMTSMAKVDEIRSFLRRIYVEYERTSKKASEATLACEESIGESNSSSLGKRKIEMDYYNFWSQNLSKRHKKNELESYLEEDVLSPDEHFDILAWWKNNANEYPILSKMARDFLAIPVSTVSSESAFSTGGRIIDSKRSRLNPSTAEALICTQDWFRDNDNQGEDDACLADGCLVIPE